MYRHDTLLTNLHARVLSETPVFSKVEAWRGRFYRPPPACGLGFVIVSGSRNIS